VSLTRLARHLLRLVPGLDVLPDIGGGAALVDGVPDRRLAMVGRYMRSLAPDEVALPLAALAAPSPATGEPLAVELAAGDPLAFVTDLASVLLPPVFGWLTLGIALEAHGQNMIGVLRGGRLRRLLYRDFGGVRVSPRRLRGHGIEAPPLQGDVRSDEDEVLRTKVLASAVSTVLGEVIATLGRAGLDETRAWERVAGVARGVPEADALFGATLPLKAMTAMRLAERSVDDLWCALPNPLAGLR
jgi:siderophore synthetase component